MKLSVAPTPDETLDRLSNRLMILQRRSGHRATSDDLFVAWAGSTFGSHSQRILDLGTGKGTVAMLLLSVLPEATAVGIEAFPQSYQLAVRNAALNQLSDRLRLVEGDLRNPGLPLGTDKFDLITGAPPFMPKGSGVLPQDAQRAAGRFELKGGVEDYYLTASRNLTSDGVVVVLMDGHGAERNLDAARRAGLHPHRRIDVLPRPRHRATYSICIAGREPAPLAVSELSMRLDTGDAWTAEYIAIRQHLDLPGGLD